MFICVDPWLVFCLGEGSLHFSFSGELAGIRLPPSLANVVRSRSSAEATASSASFFSDPRRILIVSLFMKILGV